MPFLLKYKGVISVSKEPANDNNQPRKRRYKKEPMTQEKKISLVITCAVVFVAVVFGATCLISGSLLSLGNTPASSATEETTQPESTTEETTETTTEATTEAAEETTQENSEETKENTEENDEATAVFAAGDYDYSSPVPQSAPVDDSYFSDAVFMGDSRTEGFALFSGLSTMTTYASRGLNVSTVFTDATIDLNGTMVTAIDALKSTSFSKLYIMFGLNEASWPYSDVFIDEYGDIIDEARAVNPNAVIYIQSILPVTKSCSDSSESFNKTNIDKLNGMLKQLAADKQVYYIDCEKAVADADGYLPEDSSTDGIHFGVPECEAWLEYLKTHTVSN